MTPTGVAKLAPPWDAGAQRRSEEPPIPLRIRVCLRHLTAACAAAILAVGPPRPLPAAAASSSLPVQPYHQAHGLSCEAAAALIALRLLGRDPGEEWLLAAMGADLRPAVWSGGTIVRWGDPEQSFVGSVDGSEPAGTGYGVYEIPVATAIRAQGVATAGGTGWALGQLEAEVAAGHPAVVWVISGLYAPATSYLTAWDGATVPWAFGEHAEVLAGFDDAAATVTLANPLTGTIDTVPRARFEASFAVLGNRAVVVGGAGSYAALATHPGGGYWLFGSDGSVRGFGAATPYGSLTGSRLNRPIVGAAATPSGHGYWMVAPDGGVFPFGDAGGHGSTGGIRLNRPIVGLAPTHTGNGYWLVAADGGIFPFGDAVGYGSTGGIRLNQPVVAMAVTASGRGYWLVAADGGVFPFGDAVGFGSTGAVRLNQPMVGMAADGGGYWLVAADGGIFPFGDAGGHGSTGGIHLNRPAVGLALTATGRGYLVVCADGGVFPFGDAVGLGSAA